MAAEGEFDASKARLSTRLDFPGDEGAASSSANKNDAEAADASPDVEPDLVLMRMPFTSARLVWTRGERKRFVRKLIFVLVLTYALLPLLAAKQAIPSLVYTIFLVVLHLFILVVYVYKVSFKKLDPDWRSLLARVMGLIFSSLVLWVCAKYQHKENLSRLALDFFFIWLVHSVILALMTVRISYDDGEGVPYTNSASTVTPLLPMSATIDSNSNDSADGFDLLRSSAAEFAGTFILVFIGLGAVASARISSGFGLWEVASTWGFGVAIAIYVTAERSGAHLNPAITIAHALVRPTRASVGGRGATLSRLSAYILSQLAGGFAAGLMTLAVHGASLQAYERNRGIVRGDEASVLTASVLCCFFPDPSLDSAYSGRGALFSEGDISPLRAFLTEAFATGMLALVVFALTNDSNEALGQKQRSLLGLIVGFAVAVLIAITGPLTMTGINPARDLGPRLAAVVGGWGNVALPGAKGGWWVYCLGPIVGAPIGAYLADRLIYPRQFHKPIVWVGKRH